MKMEDLQNLQNNLQDVEKKIKYACERAGRAREEVTLIAVSKTKPISMLNAIYDLGIREFGENKVQELNDKYAVMTPTHPGIHWHMLGHLQRNKVRHAIEKACLIHSLDSVRLARQIEDEAAKEERIVSVLVEVNAAQEDSKYGVSLNETKNFIHEIASYPHIRIRGLMTIAPYVENPEENRIHFRNLRQLYVDINEKNIDNVTMDILSMGMTNDYEVAIEEGATMVRIGTGIFGERLYR